MDGRRVEKLHEIAYSSHGLNGAWKLLNAIVEADEVDEGMRWLLSAKFNPFDETDRQLVGQYAKMPPSIKEALEI